MIGRTLGVWRDEAAMTEFMYSPAHIAAMRAYPEITITGKTAHWDVNGASLPPTWAEAAARLKHAAPVHVAH